MDELEYNKRILIKIAHWYYNEKMTQEEIAIKLNCTRQKINKIINSLVDMGVVTISINGIDEDKYVRLENALEKEFSVSQIVIADIDHFPNQMLIELGKKAAYWLDEFIKNKQVVGISWGEALSATVSNMRVQNKSSCNVVQLVGGMDIDHNLRMIKPDELTRLLAQKLSCNHTLLYAPAVMESNTAREAIINDSTVRKVFEMISKCDVAIVGIGQLNMESTASKLGYLSEEDLKTYEDEGYVGEIAFNPFKQDGQWQKSTHHSKVIGIDSATLEKIPYVVAVAGGMDKINAVLGALKTGCIDVLITDSILAKGLANRIGLSY